MPPPPDAPDAPDLPGPSGPAAGDADRPGPPTAGGWWPRALLVLVGGAVGTAVRAAVGHWVDPDGGWPVATFAVNLAGCLVLGVLLEALARSGPDTGGRLRARLLGGTGFCGGLTTFSTVAVELAGMLRDGRAGPALGYAAASLLGGVALAAVGVWLGGRLAARRGPAAPAAVR